MKELHNEHYKTLKKEIEEDTKRWKDLLYSLLGRINIAKITILLKAICRFNAILIKISTSIFAQIGNPKIYMET
jgi:hypothetical protein